MLTNAGLTSAPMSDSVPAPNRFRARLPIVIGATVVFVALLIVAGLTQNNILGTICGVYAIVAGILLGRLLVASEPSASAPGA
jgi:hypothetical protein